MAPTAIRSVTGPDPGCLELTNELNARLSVLALLLPGRSSIPTRRVPRQAFLTSDFSCASVLLVSRCFNLVVPAPRLQPAV